MHRQRLLIVGAAVLAASAYADDFADGVGLFKAGKFKAAAAQFEQAIDLDPANERVYTYAATCYEKLGEWAQAQKHWEAYATLAASPAAKKMAAARIAVCKRKQGVPRPERTVSLAELTRCDPRFYIARTERFIVRARNRALASLAANHAERYLTKFCNAFMRGVAWPRVTTIEIFRDHQEYLALSGMPAWSGGGFVYRTLSVDNITRRVYLFQLDESGAFVANLLTELLPHELTHLVLQEYFGERPIPRALNEGLAMYMEEGNRGDKYDWPAYEAVRRGRPFPLSELYAAFGYPKDPKRVWLFYSQSASATRFLVDRLGPESTAKMLAEVKHGRSMEDALRRATGQRGDVLGGIERAWRRNILKHPPKKPKQMKRPADLNKK